jgi:hypothetical protein
MKERGVEAVNPENRIDESTRDMLRDILYEGLQDGLTNEEIADQLDDLGPYPFSEERAALIANTEIANAHNAGALIGAQEGEDAFGVTLKKRWLTAGPEHDVEACSDCQDNEDEGQLDTDEEFPSGDINPPAHPRCRCVLVFDVVDDSGNTIDEGEDDNTDDSE